MRIDVIRVDHQAMPLNLSVPVVVFVIAQWLFS
jgi:hypothetical protein